MPEPTCWTLIHAVADGEQDARDEFAGRYLPVIRSYLDARWGRRLSTHELDDVVQEVFVECLRDQGPLERASPTNGSSFRGYLCGVVKNVAQRVESRRCRLDAPAAGSAQLDAVARDETTLTRIFDRAFTESLLAEAGGLQERRARDGSERERTWVRLLHERFRDGRSVSEIGRDLGLSTRSVHHEYECALRSFEACLRDVIAYHHPDAPEAVQRECRALLEALP